MTLPTSGGKILLHYGDVPGDSLARAVTLTASGVESGGEKTVNLTVDLVNPNVITGTVYDASMRPVPGAKVFLSRWDGVGRFVGYNSTEGGNATDGNGVCDGNGTYRFAVMPAGDYLIKARDSAFNNSTQLTVVRGTYVKNIVLPMERGSIKGWVKDAKGNGVPGVNVTLNRVYESSLKRTASNVSDANGRFDFDDVWFGNYDVQAVVGDQTADMPLVLDVSKSSVTLTLLKAVPSATPAPAANATPTVKTNVSATPKAPTPKPPTPTPPPVTGDYLLNTYGVALAVMALVCIALLTAVLRFRQK
jgi:hypothetical protein